MPTPDYFRGEALEHFAAAERKAGGTVRLSPAWLRHSYRLLLLTTLAGAALIAFGRVNEYAAGPAVLALSEDRASFEVIAALPARWRPGLREGAPLRVALPTGYRTLRVESAGAQLLSAEQAREALGPTALPPAGAAFLVRARLPASALGAPEQAALYDGQPAQVRVRAREVRLWRLLFPWLSGPDADGHGA